MTTHHPTRPRRRRSTPPPASCTCPAIRDHAGRLAEQAATSQGRPISGSSPTPSRRVDDRAERRRTRRIHEARFPRIKRLADFDFDVAPTVNPATIATLASGSYLDAGEPVVLLGDSGTGKTHLLIGLGIAACEQGRRVRYATCAQLVNELVEAADERRLARLVARYGRLDLLCVDELGYVQLDARGAELLFQILTEREEKASIGLASNLPFSEWGTDHHRPPPRRRRRRPRHLQRPHHRDRHRLLPAPHQPNPHPQDRLTIRATPKQSLARYRRLRRIGAHEPHRDIGAARVLSGRLVEHRQASCIERVAPPFRRVGVAVIERSGLPPDPVDARPPHPAMHVHDVVVCLTGGDTGPIGRLVVDVLLGRAINDVAAVRARTDHQHQSSETNAAAAEHHHSVTLPTLDRFPPGRHRPEGGASSSEHRWGQSGLTHPDPVM